MKRTLIAGLLLALAMPSAAAAGDLRLKVTPKVVEPGKQSTLRFRAMRNGHGVKGVLVRLEGTKARTNRTGHAVMTLALPEQGEYTASAESAKKTVVARYKRAPAQRAEQFTGDCEFTGTVLFQPWMTNTPQTIAQDAKATGVCTGTFTDKDGTAHELADAPVGFAETSTATDSTCLAGTADGTGSLTFPDGVITVGFDEKRAGGTPFLTLPGQNGGTAHGLAYPAPGGDPMVALKCGQEGLDHFDFAAQFHADGLSG